MNPINTSLLVSSSKVRRSNLGINQAWDKRQMRSLSPYGRSTLYSNAEFARSMQCTSSQSYARCRSKSAPSLCTLSPCRSVKNTPSPARSPKISANQNGTTKAKERKDSKTLENAVSKKHTSQGRVIKTFAKCSIM